MLAIQSAHNEALRIITGSYKMSSIEHLHSETKMIQVEDHLNLHSAQYLVHCLDTGKFCHHITTMDHPPKVMKETLFTRHNQTMLPLLANTKKESLQAIYTSFVNTAIDNMKFNQQFNTSKLGRHTSSSETRLVTRETKRKSLEMAQTFTTDIVRRAIKSCRNSKAFVPDKLSIFHLKNLGPEY